MSFLSIYDTPVRERAAPPPAHGMGPSHMWWSRAQAGSERLPAGLSKPLLRETWHQPRVRLTPRISHQARWLGLLWGWEDAAVSPPARAAGSGQGTHSESQGVTSCFGVQTKANKVLHPPPHPPKKYTYCPDFQHFSWQHVAASPAEMRLWLMGCDFVPHSCHCLCAVPTTVEITCLWKTQFLLFL